MDTTTFEKPASQEQFRKSFIEALTGYKIAKITAVNEVEDTFSFLAQHGVLLDAELADEAHTKCHIAIQMHSPHMCERHIRCVQSDIDCRTMRFTEWDEDEYLTHKSCVVLICLEDPHGRGLAAYRRTNSIGGVEFDNGAQVVILNADFRTQNVIPLVGDFLRYLKGESEIDVVNDVDALMEADKIIKKFFAE